MKKSYLLLLLFFITIFLFSGCRLFDMIFQKTDVYVSYVEGKLMDNRLSTIDFGIFLEAKESEDVQYLVVYSNDDFIDERDFKLYEDTVYVGKEENISLDFREDILRNSNIEEIVNNTGDYYIGVIADVWDDIKERDEENNSRSTGSMFRLPPDDDYEPNNSFEEAYDIRNWESITVENCIQFDEDYYLIFLETGDTDLDVHLEIMEGDHPLGVNIYDASRSLVYESSAIYDINNSNPTALTGGQDYFIKVFSWEGNVTMTSYFFHWQAY